MMMLNGCYLYIYMKIILKKNIIDVRLKHFGYILGLRKIDVNLNITIMLNLNILKKDIKFKHFQC